MKKIVLYGRLAKEFGKEFMIDVNSVAQAIRAMEANFSGKFYKAIEDGLYKVEKRSSKGKGHSYSSDFKPSHEDFLAMKSGCDEIHIEPVLQGSGGGGDGKKKGAIQLIVGVALIVAATIVSGGAAAGVTATILGVETGTVAAIGVSLALSGVATMLTKVPSLRAQSITNRERPEERASFIFNGAVNNVEQGGPVPLVYGEMLVGSVVINASLNSEDIAT